MIYVIDTGFGYINHPLAMLVYGQSEDGNHGANQLAVITDINPNEIIYLCELGSQPTNEDILNALKFVNKTAPDDAVICISFSIHYNEEIDNLITKMSDKFNILVAGGNEGGDMSQLTPCNNDSVITVGSLNKSNQRASHNSVGTLDLLAPGTNIDINGIKVSGTSVATAIATGYFSKHKTIEKTHKAIQEDFDHIITCRY